MRIKEALYAHCVWSVHNRMERIQEEIGKIQASANEETKSSAGDKYETGRAMAQLEVERSMQQLNEARKLKLVLQTLVVDRISEVAIPGSLVRTSNGTYFIAISLGVVTLEQSAYMVISQESPIGKLLLGRRVGESITWNKKSYLVHTIE